MNESMETNAERVIPVLFSETIKSATAQRHILLESNSLLSALVSPRVTIRQYGCYLSLMQNIVSYYESNILPLVAIEQRKSAPLIEADLQNINYSLRLNETMHSYDIGVENITVPFAWGFAYVMEGAKLGGKVIFKNIQRNLALSESVGGAFIADYGVNTFAVWKEWMLKFSGYVAAHHCEEETINGARYAFDSVYDYFQLNRLLYED